MAKKLFLPLWIVASLALFFYSFTQVDLSLTFSRASIYQTIEKGFQYVGWFNRPLSTYLYIGIFTILFSLYIWTLDVVKKKLIPQKTLWLTIVIVTVILALSYNAFSYDLFNYIFDAKIVSFYHSNPYIHKALDFPHDPMLSFMHWTHRTYPYGPVWLALTVPLSIIGNHIFIVTFYLFKLLMAASFIFTVWSIGKIGKTLKITSIALPIAAFAFNPYVLSESLVSAHNDIVMMGFAMFGVYLILQKKYVKGGIHLAISIGIKFATALLMLALFILWGTKKKEHFIGACILAMIISAILATLRTTFQPWYLLYIVPFAALYIEKIYVKIPVFVISIGAVVYYCPFLYTGSWDEPIPSILNVILFLIVILSLVSGIVGYFFERKHAHVR